MDAVVLKGEEEIHCYDYLRFSQLEWYRSFSAMFTAQNRGVPVPSFAFFHIPLREVAEGLSAGGRILAGNNCEPPCPSRLNSGMLAQMRELGDVQAVVTGHDHDCDYVLDYGQMYYIYGRFSAWVPAARGCSSSTAAGRPSALMCGSSAAKSSRT